MLLGSAGKTIEFDSSTRTNNIEKGLDPIFLAGKTIEFGGPTKLNFFESGSPIRPNILGSDFIVENQIFFFMLKQNFQVPKHFLILLLNLKI
jgi:hypothetical protein